MPHNILAQSSSLKKTPESTNVVSSWSYDTSSLRPGDPAHSITQFIFFLPLRSIKMIQSFSNSFSCMYVNKRNGNLTGESDFLWIERVFRTMLVMACESQMLDIVQYVPLSSKASLFDSRTLKFSHFLLLINPRSWGLLAIPQSWRMNSSCKQRLLWWQGVMVYLFGSQKHTRGYEAIRACSWAHSWPSWESPFCSLFYRRLTWRELGLWSQIATPWLEFLPCQGISCVTMGRVS